MASSVLSESTTAYDPFPSSFPKEKSAGVNEGPDVAVPEDAPAAASAAAPFFSSSRPHGHKHTATEPRTYAQHVTAWHKAGEGKHMAVK